MELTNGSDLILVLKLEDKKGEPMRVKDCLTFKVRVWTTNRANCLSFTKTQINQSGDIDKIPINSTELNKLESGVIRYDYDYSVYDENFETDMKYDKVKEVVTDFYWRNVGIETGNGQIGYEELNRVYDKLAEEEDARMLADNKLAEAINWLNLNACIKGSCSVIKDKDGNVIREFVVADDVAPTYSQEEIDAQFEEINDRIDTLEDVLENTVSELETKHNEDIAEVLKDSKQYTDDKVKEVTHNIEDNYYNREYIDNLEEEVYKDIVQAKTDANKYTDTKYNNAIQYVDSNLLNYYTREEADNLHSNALLDVNNKFLNYYKKNETDALLEALEAEIDGNFKNYYTKPQVNNLLADVKEQIPTAVSELENDLGFLTRHQSLALYAKTADVQAWLKDSEDYAKEYFQPKGDYATVANVKYMIERLINTAPEALDTLGEIAEKLKSNDDLHASLIDLLRRKANADLVYTKSETDKMFRDAVLEIQNGFSLQLVDYFTKDECNARFQPIGDYATKSEIPSLNGYATEQWVRNQNYLTQHQDLSEYALKSYVDSKVANVTVDLSNYYTKGEVENKIQQEVSNVTVDAYTKAESDSKYQPKGDYLTEVPEEYAKTEDVEKKIAEAVTGGEVDLSSYLTKTEASSTYMTISDANSTFAKIWSGSQSQYDSLGTYDNNTIYIIVG